MSDIEAQSFSVHRDMASPANKPANLILVTALALLLVGAGVALSFLQREQAEPLVLGLLGLLSAVGVAALFGAAIGLLRMGDTQPADTLFSQFMDTMAEGVLITDSKNQIIYANQSYARLTGQREGGGARVVERVFATDADAAEAIFRLTQAALEGRRAQEEIRISHPLTPDQDSPCWYRVRVRPLLRDAVAGAPNQDLVVWHIADITRDRDEQETSFQELQRAINFLDHAPAGFFSADPQGRILYMNATLVDWLGHDLAQFDLGRVTLGDIVRGNGAALVDAAVKGRPGEAHTEIVDVDLEKRGGEFLPVRLLHRTPFAADGTRGDSRTLVINRSPGEDVSEELRAAEMRFARFFNNTPIAIAALSAGGDIRNANAPFLRLAKDAGSEKGKKLSELVEPRDQAKLAEALKDTVAGKADVMPVDAAIRGDTIAGDTIAGERDERTLKFYFAGVSDPGKAGADDSPVIVYAMETTEQRALEAQFAQSQKMQAIGQLAGGVAHDFNNVLTAIIGFSDLLLASHRPKDPAFQDIMNIRQNANRAAGLVRQLLAFSRRQTLVPQRLEINSMIADLSILLDRLLGEQVELKVTHGRELWPIMGDLNQLEQVIINLAVNARDAMPKGGTLSIKTANATDSDIKDHIANGMKGGEFILISVQDTGTGMPPEVLEKIFEPFFSTKAVGKGTGLGLSTVYGIVKQTGGYIYCDSKQGEGTDFQIFLPRYVPTETEQVAKAVDETSVIADLSGSASILLVEDEDAVRAFSARALASRGYTVHEAATGAEALEVLEETGGEIDLVVSDVVMPEMDGPTLLRKLREKHPDLKVIFVSGYAEEAFRKNLPENEKFGFLPKPFSLRQLATTVKETLSDC